MSKPLITIDASGIRILGDKLTLGTDGVTLKYADYYINKDWSDNVKICPGTMTDNAACEMFKCPGNISIKNDTVFCEGRPLKKLVDKL